MASYVGISNHNPTKYLGPNVQLVSIVTRNRAPTGADIRQGTTGQYYPIGSEWIVSKDPTTGVEGDKWWLSKIAANVAYWVQYDSGVADISSFNVDAHTAPGTDPVVPDVGGQITITGGQVASATVGANVIRTDSLAANTYTIEIQRSTNNASPDSTLNGVSHFDSAVFNVDSTGFVTLTGGGMAVDSFGVQAFTGPGTNPVVPTVAGLVTINGATVAAHGIPLQSDSIAANTLQIEVQRATSSATTDATGQGVASFKSSDFTVDANGWVSASDTGVGQTITGDSGGALSPSAGNWNILGAGGIVTSGSGSTLTITGTVPVYTTGTFTPTVAFAGSSTGVTYSLQAGQYTRIGNIVNFFLRVDLTSKGSHGASDRITISGPPITVGSTQECYSNVYSSYLSWDAGFTYVLAVAVPGTQTFYIDENQINRPTSNNPLVYSNYADNTELVITGFYYVD